VKNSMGECIFKNIASLSLAILCLPFSNASVERVFSIMNIVKNKLRNRMNVESLDAILNVKFSLQRLSMACHNFVITDKMLSLFNHSIYEESEKVTIDCDVFENFGDFIENFDDDDDDMPGLIHLQ